MRQTTPIEAPYPSLLNLNALRYVKIERVAVWSEGPPIVSSQIITKFVKDHIVSKSTSTEFTYFKPGNVI